MQAANEVGVVENVEEGRKVLVKTDKGKEILCCRPVLQVAEGMDISEGKYSLSNKLWISGENLTPSTQPVRILIVFTADLPVWNGEFPGKTANFVMLIFEIFIKVTLKT